MSQENVAALREFFRRFNEGDFWLDLFSPDVELQEPEAFPDRKTIRGREAMRTWLESWGKLWHEPRMDVVDTAAPTETTVVVLIRFSGRARRSEIPLDASYLVIVTMVDGRISRVKLRAYNGEDLEAVGLSE
jgi:ketosteroid isomerase-like protein